MGRAVMVETPRSDVDVSALTEWGTLTTLFTPPPATRDGRAGWRPRPSTTDVMSFARRVGEELDRIGFDPARDYLVMTGGILQVSLALAACQMKYPRFRVLVFSAQTGDYVVKEWTRDEVLAKKGDTPCNQQTISRNRAPIS